MTERILPLFAACSLFFSAAPAVLSAQSVPDSLPAVDMTALPVLRMLPSDASAVCFVNGGRIMQSGILDALSASRGRDLNASLKKANLTRDELNGVAAGALTYADLEKDAFLFQGVYRSPRNNAGALFQWLTGYMKKEFIKSERLNVTTEKTVFAGCPAFRAVSTIEDSEKKIIVKALLVQVSGREIQLCLSANVPESKQVLLKTGGKNPILFHLDSNAMAVGGFNLAKVLEFSGQKEMLTPETEKLLKEITNVIISLRAESKQQFFLDMKVICSSAEQAAALEQTAAPMLMLLGQNPEMKKIAQKLTYKCEGSAFVVSMGIPLTDLLENLNECRKNAPSVSASR